MLGLFGSLSNRVASRRAKNLINVTNFHVGTLVNLLRGSLNRSAGITFGRLEAQK